MESITKQWTVRDRTAAIFKGERPDHMPFVDRLELWYITHSRAGTLPAEYRDLSLTEIHRQIGIGQQKFAVAYAHRLKGVEITVRFEGEVVQRETDPVIEGFPRISKLAIHDRPGVTAFELRTPVGNLTMKYQMIQAMIETGSEPYMIEHWIKEEADYRTVEYILERAECVSLYERIRREEAALGDIGYVVPTVGRIPFQQVLLEYLGDLNTFYAIHDTPHRVERFLEVLDRRVIEDLRTLADVPLLYVEFVDNIHGLMTNQKLFARYCLPEFQRYAEILHAQGKRMGSHIDGDPRPLLQLVAESGLDVCESFSPAPLTPCPFEEAWEAWVNGPVIWGGIPSPILEGNTSEEDFRAFVDHVLEVTAEGPIILGIGDQVMGTSIIERVQYIADRVEALEG